MKTCRVSVNGQGFRTKAGTTLLDAALANGVNIPHDCRSGLCGSCLTRVKSGSTILGETAVPGMVYACKARILTDLEIEVEDVPQTRLETGRLAGLRALTSDTVELAIRPEGHLAYLPGQYFKFKFDGFPERSYSATRAVDGRPEGSHLVLHVRRYPNGRVSGQFGRRIKPGHRVEILGPFGSAFFRPEKQNRLVLISSGTGFAPIWSIACAALRENFRREIRVIAGVRTESEIYMAAALERLAACPNVDVRVTIGRRPGIGPYVLGGYPTDHMPALKDDDIVYACGPAQMIELVSPIAAAAGATLYTDPFEPAPEDVGRKLLDTTRDLFNGLINLKAGASPAIPNAARAVS
jgi:CDP-4-dehydro-6-deoxyglucose reductase